MIEISDERVREVRVEARHLLERGLLAIRSCVEAYHSDGVLDRTVRADLYLLSDELHNLPGVVAGDFGWYGPAIRDFDPVWSRIDRLLEASRTPRRPGLLSRAFPSRWLRIIIAVSLLVFGLINYLSVGPTLYQGHILPLLMVGGGGLALTLELAVWLLIVHLPRVYYGAAFGEGGHS